MAQDRPIGPPPPVVLHHADSFFGRQSDSGEVRELRGNVHLQQGTTILRCGSALQYLETGLVILRQNVYIEQGDLHISAPTITYNPVTGIATAENGAEVRQGKRTIRARWGMYDIPRRELLFQSFVHFRDDSIDLRTDTLRYFRLTERAHARGGVYVESPLQRLAAEADTLDYQPRSGWMRFAGSVILHQRPASTTSSTDTLWLMASTATIVQSNGRSTLEASGSIALVQDTSWAARAESIRWQSSAEILSLRGTPVIWYGNAELTGDSVVVVFFSGQFHRLHCVGRSRLRLRTATDSIRTHQLRADSIFLRRQNDSLTELIAFGNAR
ncbi:MAG: hypothetical protein NZ473_08695, partial [Candidatus Kapabacteria bacterium]|nr:hypothetical protein [Candidatus Kapabacteria bacterium]